MNSNWNYPTTIWVGEGRIKDLYLACNQLKIKKPLFGYKRKINEKYYCRRS